MAAKDWKKKTKEEHLADILNAQILKGNVTKAQVKDEHKAKIKT